MLGGFGEGEGVGGGRGNWAQQRISQGIATAARKISRYGVGLLYKVRSMGLMKLASADRGQSPPRPYWRKIGRYATLAVIRATAFGKPRPQTALRFRFHGQQRGHHALSERAGSVDANAQPAVRRASVVERAARGGMPRCRLPRPLLACYVADVRPETRSGPICYRHRIALPIQASHQRPGEFPSGPGAAPPPSRSRVCAIRCEPRAGSCSLPLITPPRGFLSCPAP